MQARSDRLARIVGREPEYEVLREFLGADAAAGALALIGGPGIGKTTLWEAGIALGRERGWRVLCARPSRAEAQLSFAALIDLFDGVETGALARSAPSARRVGGGAAARPAQWRAARAARDRARLPQRGRGRWRAAGGWLVAIDDVQWLDPPSADALAFAVRRLKAEPVVFLLARRPGRPSVLERALEDTRSGARSSRSAESRRDAPVARPSGWA